MRKTVTLLLTVVIMLSLSGCGSTGLQVKAWSWAVDSIESADAKYEELRDNGWDYTKAQEPVQKTYINKIKTLSFLGVTLDEAFLTEYLKNHTIEELYNDYSSLHHNDGVIYNEDYMPDKVANWAEQLSADFWNALQNYYDLKPTTLSNLYSTDRGAYYSEHPDAKPQEKTSSVKALTSIDDNGNEHYDTKDNTITVQYYGDYAIANEKTWRYGGGTYGWVNGEFVDKQDKWICDETTHVYYMGKEIFSGSASECRTTKVLFVDGVLFGLYRSKYDDSQTVIRLDD